MGSLADLIGIVEEGEKSVIKLVSPLDYEPMNPEPRRIRSDSGEGRLVNLLLEVEEAGEALRSRSRTRESTDSALERDGRLRHRCLIRAAGGDRLLEAFVERTNMLSLVAEVILDGPDHSPKHTARRQRAGRRWCVRCPEVAGDEDPSCPPSTAGLPGPADTHRAKVVSVIRGSGDDSDYRTRNEGGRSWSR